MKDFLKIKHFLNRAGFGMNPENYRIFKNSSFEQVVHTFFEADTRPLIYEEMGDESHRSMQTQEEFLKKRKRNIKNTAKVRGAWIERMIHVENPLIERVSLFWHGHFACRIIHPGLATQYLNVLRNYGMGGFKDLVLAMAQNPAMIRYLNNQQNRKGNPNENFTRELMELFTLGRGNYTEQDVKEGARAFTGWSSNLKGEFVIRPFFHDNGVKHFLGQQGNFGGEDIINIILNKKECATFLATSIFKYFVNEDLEQDKISSIADLLWNNGFHIGDTLKSIFLSDWFYDDVYVGNKIKSPVELLVGVCRQSGTQKINLSGLQYLSKAMGQALFNPPNVAGWPGGKKWIDNATLSMRLNIPTLFFNNPISKKLNLNVEHQLSKIDEYILDDQQDPLEAIANFILNSTEWNKNQLLMEIINNVFGSDQDPANLAIGLMSTPEYQMC